MSTLMTKEELSKEIKLTKSSITRTESKIFKLKKNKEKL